MLARLLPEGGGINPFELDLMSLVAARCQGVHCAAFKRAANALHLGGPAGRVQDAGTKADDEHGIY